MSTQHDPQLEAYRSMPQRTYVRTALIIDTIMELGRRKCVGGECDLDSPCRRHRLSVRTAERYWARKEAKR